MPTKSWSDLLNDAGDAGGNYEPLPEGDYDFSITECKVTTASTGRTMYVAKCGVEAGPYNKKSVWHNFVITPENPTALGWFFRNMKVLGFGQDYFNTNPSDHHVAEALVGRRFRGQVKIRSWQGQEKNEIKAFFSPSGAGVPAPAGAPAPVHAAPPPAVAVAPPPPPPPPPAPAPAVQPVVAPPVAETPPPPPVPPAPPTVAEMPPAPEPAMAASGETAPPPPPF